MSICYKVIIFTVAHVIIEKPTHFLLANVFLNVNVALMCNFLQIAVDV